MEGAEKKSRTSEEPSVPVPAPYHPMCLLQEFVERGGGSFLTNNERVPLSVDHAKVVRESAKSLTNFYSNPSPLTRTYRNRPDVPACALLQSLNQFTTLHRLTLIIQSPVDIYVPWGSCPLPTSLVDLCVDGMWCELPVAAFLKRLQLHHLPALKSLQLGCRGETDVDMILHFLKTANLPQLERLTLAVSKDTRNLLETVTSVLTTPGCLPKLSALCVHFISVYGSPGEIPTPFFHAVIGRRLQEVKIICGSRVKVPSNVDFFPVDTTNVIFSTYRSHATILELLNDPNPCAKAWGMHILIRQESYGNTLTAECKFKSILPLFMS